VLLPGIARQYDDALTGGRTDRFAHANRIVAVK
jgi:hypothetical protein